MLELQKTIEEVLGRATLHRPHSFDYVTLEAAKEVRKATLKIGVTRLPGVNHYAVELIDEAARSVTPVAMGEIMARAGMISGTAFAKTQYGKAADDPFFHMLYNVKERALMYMEAGTECSKAVSSAPCMMCGVILPLRNLTVDHQRPQSGGESEAVLKTFRAFGFTKAGPKGVKGQRILDHFTNGARMQPAMPQLGRPALPTGTTVADRYSLNVNGAILYSFIVAGGKRDELQNQCMHGLLNLKPLCQTCNSSRGNPLKVS